MVVPLGGGVHRFVGIDPAGGADSGGRADQGQPDPGHRLRHARSGLLSRFGNATRQAAAYRAGCVLLAGDAAHAHFPTGGVGLNVGIQDATNLGWKLAATVTGKPATVTGKARADLLDAYHAERHPVGAELLARARAQTALMTAYSPEGRCLSDIILDVPALSRRLAERVSGVDVRHPATGSSHPLVGRRVPDLGFEDSAFSLETWLLRAGWSARAYPRVYCLARRIGVSVLNGRARAGDVSRCPGGLDQARADLVSCAS